MMISFRWRDGWLSWASPLRYVCSRGLEGLENARMIAAAHRNPLSVDQKNGKVAAGFCAHLFDVLQIDNRGTVNPREHRRIEFLLEIGHGLAEQMGFSSGADAHVVFLRTDPANIGNGKEENPTTRFEDHAGGVLAAIVALAFAPAAARLSCRADLCDGPCDRGAKPLRRKGLEQVVDGIHFEGTERIGIPGRGENDAGRGRTGQGVELVEQRE